jgi:hypothetical protein
VEAGEKEEEEEEAKPENAVPTIPDSSSINCAPPTATPHSLPSVEVESSEGFSIHVPVHFDLCCFEMTSAQCSLLTAC